MEPRMRKGAMAPMVVRLVIRMGFSRRHPPKRMARSNGIPSRRRRFMVSTFRMESLITMPAITTMPMSDIRLILLPAIQRASSAPKMSTATSERMISGWASDSNCAARMKNRSSNETSRTRVSSWIIARLSYQPPA